MAEPASCLAPDQPDWRAEVTRLNKIIRVLMDRAERSTSAQGSDFSLFQTTLTLEGQVRRRIAEVLSDASPGSPASLPARDVVRDTSPGLGIAAGSSTGGASQWSAVGAGRASLPGPTCAMQDCYVDRTRVVVDNSKGAEAEFVSNLRAALSAAGFEVEVREPSPQALYDTTVHFVVEGVSVRVPGELGRHELQVVAAAVRDAEARRSERRRVRAVPIYQGETSCVLAWVDILASDAL